MTITCFFVLYCIDFNHVWLFRTVCDVVGWNKKRKTTFWLQFKSSPSGLSQWVNFRVLELKFDSLSVWCNTLMLTKTTCKGWCSFKHKIPTNPPLPYFFRIDLSLNVFRGSCLTTRVNCTTSTKLLWETATANKTELCRHCKPMQKDPPSLLKCEKNEMKHFTPSQRVASESFWHRRGCSWWMLCANDPNQPHRGVIAPVYRCFPFSSPKY